MSMIKAIFDGICSALANEFELSVYTERIVQGANEPCLTVRLDKSEEELFFGKKYIMRNTFKIAYLDETRREHLNSTAVVERLYAALDVIDYGGGLVRGSNIRCVISENMLEVYVNYDIFVYRSGGGDDETGLMQSLETEMIL